MRVNGNKVSGLIHSASSERFIDKEIAQRLKLIISPVIQSIILAQSSSKASIPGECKMNLFKKTFLPRDTTEGY